MNKLFNKLDYYIDYNNSYSLRKAMTTLSREFNLATVKKNIEHARLVIDALRKLYEKSSQAYQGTKNYENFQKPITQQMKKLIGHFTRRLKTEFGVGEHEPEIEQTIG